MSLSSLTEKILSGAPISKEDALRAASVKGTGLFEFFSHANTLREAFRGDIIDLCSIVNAKSGTCPEDCSYCAQSARAKTAIETYPLKEEDFIVEKAKEAKESGAKRFCIVTSGKKPSGAELLQIASMVAAVRDLGLLPCATLGLLREDELRLLKDSGLERFHHNIETSERFFPHVCSTHSYEEKIKTIKAVKSSGLSLCSGGIFGLGETWEDRVEMAFLLRELKADSIPINFLMPIKGTPLGDIKPLEPLEALKVISLMRFILPEKEIRVCGGRLQTLGEFNSFVFMAGADGLLIGNYLTTEGRSPEDDLRLIKMYGLKH